MIDPKPDDVPAQDCSNELAVMQEQLENTKTALTMFETLFEINQYMNNTLDIDQLLPVVEDVVRGMVGAKYCMVLLPDSNPPQEQQPPCPLRLSYTELCRDGMDTTFIEDLSITPVYNLDKGCLYIHRVALENDTYGFIIAYWDVPFSVTDKKIKFLSILSTQTGLCIKSARLLEKFKLLAMHDPLTGIYNRAYFNTLETTSSPVVGECMVMFDLDNFKNINDTRGHATGDEILQQFASVLLAETNASGAICFKYGGEEFVLKCTGGEAEGVRLADRIRRRFQENTGYTASAGVASMGVSCKISNYHTLLNLADSAMYVSKQCGRNRTTLSNSDLQLFSKAGSDLCAALSRSARSDSELPCLIRIDVPDTYTMTEEDLTEFQAELQGILRIYDQVHVAESLSVLMILDMQEPVQVESTLRRITDLLSEKYPALPYTIFDCSSIVHEVVAHSRRVAATIERLSPLMELSVCDTSSIRLAAEWYDIGKLFVDPAIYTKPSTLTAQELNRIQYHAWLGSSLAKQNKSLRSCAQWILLHHEDYDGGGYYGYHREDIPLQAQVLSLVDKLNAMTENRYYRSALSPADALTQLRSEQHRFYPPLFQKFMKIAETTPLIV